MVQEVIVLWIHHQPVVSQTLSFVSSFACKHRQRDRFFSKNVQNTIKCNWTNEETVTWGMFGGSWITVRSFFPKERRTLSSSDFRSDSLFHCSCYHSKHTHLINSFNDEEGNRQNSQWQYLWHPKWFGRKDDDADEDTSTSKGRDRPTSSLLLYR